jgi:NhaA family Na+:H+ antiporter
LNYQDTLDKAGWAIPMATDIAFAVGILALLGKRVPSELKVFLLALAIVDDLGAILVIALFYTKQLSIAYLLMAIIPFSLIYLTNKYKPAPRFVYIFLGVASWYLIYKSGIHATIAGVILAFLSPFTLKKNENFSTTPLTHWLYKLHPVVTFTIMPFFAFFNAGLSMHGISFSDLIHSDVSLGVALGLILGKPIGIVTFCYLSCAMKVSKLPDNINWSEMIGVSLIAGIGFTMSLFINNLTFAGTDIEDFAKLGILVGSIISALMGYTVLRFLLNRRKTQAAA